MSELRDDSATARAMYIDMMAQCHDMLARCDGLEASQEVADVRAGVIEMAAKLEKLAYWLGCLEWHEGVTGRMRQSLH